MLIVMRFETELPNVEHQWPNRLKRLGATILLVAGLAAINYAADSEHDNGAGVNNVSHTATNTNETSTSVTANN